MISPLSPVRTSSLSEMNSGKRLLRFWDTTVS